MESLVLFKSIKTPKKHYYEKQSLRQGRFPWHLLVLVAVVAWTAGAIFVLYQCQRRLASETGWSAANAKAAGKPKQAGSVWKTLDGNATILFAHRGEKILLPEHTLPAYEIASILEADFVEPDLQLTKDNFFVCHHDPFLKNTDVDSRPEFAYLKTREPDGTVNWYIRNFTLAELRTLKIKQENVGIRPMDFNLMFPVPTFEEYLQMIHEMTYKLKRVIGIVPELKNPAFNNEGKEANHMEKEFLKLLAAHGYPIKAGDRSNCTAKIGKEVHPIACPPAIIQCFERYPLEFLKTQTNIDLLMLADEDPRLLTYEGMKEVSQFANYYSVYKEYLYEGAEIILNFTKVPWDREEIRKKGGFVPPVNITQEAHKLDMRVVLYTFKDSREPSTRGCAFPTGCDNTNKTVELEYYFNLGVDGMFVENVAESRDIRNNYYHKELLRQGQHSSAWMNLGNNAEWSNFLRLP